MFSFFRSPPLLASARVDWLFECFAWLLKNGGGMERLKRSPLVTPTDEFFPQRVTSEHAGIEAIFRQVQLHAGMKDSPCELRAETLAPSKEVADRTYVQHMPHPPHGTFGERLRAGQTPEIVYDPKSTHDPMQFVAMFAHEFAHYFTSGFNAPPPFFTETEYVYALAIFCHLRGIERSQMRPHLDANLHGALKRACKEIERDRRRVGKMWRDAADRPS
jgi:hypothetical protein